MACIWCGCPAHFEVRYRSNKIPPPTSCVARLMQIRAGARRGAWRRSKTPRVHGLWQFVQP